MSIVKDFSWGQVLNVYEVGPYQVIEFHPRKVDGATVTRQINFDKLNYQPYVDGKDTNCSYHSLDAALAGAIAYRAEGCNHRGDRYFIAAMEAVAEGRK